MSCPLTQPRLLDRGKVSALRVLLAVILMVAGLLMFRSLTVRSQSPAASSARPELVIQSGHSSSVNCVVFAPDRRWLATGSADNSIRIWDSDSGLELRALLGHQNWIRTIAVNSNGTLLASGSNDRTVRLWDVASGNERATLSGHQGVINAVTFSIDGQLVLSASADKTIRVWEVASGALRQTLSGHNSDVTAIRSSPDGKTFASAGSDGEIRIWSSQDWSGHSIVNRRPSRISTLMFSPDSRRLATGTVNGEVIIWDVATGKERLRVTQNDKTILALAFANETDVWFVNAEGSLISVDSNGSQRVALKGNREDSELTFVAFSNDRQLLAFSTGNRSVEIRNAGDGTLARTLESHAAGFFSIAFSGDGRWLAASAIDRTIRVWQTATGREMPRIGNNSGWVQAIAFSPDSNLLASASQSGEVKLRDVSSGRETFSRRYDGDRIQSIAFSSDGRYVAAGGVSQTIHLVDLNTKQSYELAGHQGEITGLAFLPNSATLVSGSTDKTVKSWDVSTRALSRTLSTEGADVNTLAVSPDGSLLAIGTADQKVHLISVDGSSGAAERTLTGHAGEIFALAFSRDGKKLASAGRDRVARTWDPASGASLQTFTGTSSEINDVDFSADSRFLVTATGDGSINVWNAETGIANAIMVSIPETDDWLAITPQGLFDGSYAAWKLLLWRFGQNTFKISPVESYFNEFYYPGLLADVLANKNPRAAQDIIEKDRRQPAIKITSETAAVSSRTAPVKLEIAEAPPDAENSAGSGVRDVRLFRNGLMIQAWAGDVLQNTARRVIETEVPIVAGRNELTAYAFNRDNVKSRDAGLVINGAESLRRTGTAYVVVIGVGEYENPQYNLNYSVADAAAIASQLKSQQEALGRYQPVETVSLINAEATKQNILLALKLLAGTFKGPLPPGAPPDLSKLKPAQPEDAVVFYFSGHGTARGDRFYLIPRDLGYKGPRKGLDESGLKTILEHSISDFELEETLKPIDADQLLLIIDACNSGQALQATEQRRGPMNTRGIAQLAYEKGMYVLTAAQSDEVAFESAGLKHSYLAYALVEEGIKSGAADANHNGQIVLTEWFNYATDRVPRIHSTKQVGGKQLEEVDDDEKRVQRPRVFNMRESSAERFVIARLARSASGR